MTEITHYIDSTGFWDSVCNLCIYAMEYLSHVTGLSYGFINIWLFVLMGPLSTLIFMASSVVAKTRIKYSRQISIALDIIGIIIVLSMLIPIGYALLTMPLHFY